jgi:hypothetical protein
LATSTGVPLPNFLAACSARAELRPALERVGPLAGFDLDQLGPDLETVRGGEGLNRLPLRLDPQPVPALLRRAHPQVRHRRLHRRSPRRR